MCTWTLWPFFNNENWLHIINQNVIENIELILTLLLSPSTLCSCKKDFKLFRYQENKKERLSLSLTPILQGK